ncbi:hypothetical protein [Agrococcus sp. TSP3-2-1]|uniref:hypothetical protein n=1 Tax=Agrococcus sp. TSP3-2-1 TaxID=2804583 RepID=UPI003CEE7582
MEAVLAELSSLGVPTVVVLVIAVGLGVVLAQALGLVAWSILRATRRSRAPGSAKRDPRRPAA